MYQVATKLLLAPASYLCKRYGKVYSDKPCNMNPNIVYLKANGETNNYNACLF